MNSWYFPFLLFVETFIVTLLPMFTLIYSLMDSINQKKEIMRMQQRTSNSHSRTTVGGGGARDYGTVLSDFSDEELKTNNNRVRYVKSFLEEQENENSASFRGDN